MNEVNDQRNTISAACRMVLVFLLFGLFLQSPPASAQSNVLLAVDLSVGEYDSASFGRVLELHLFYRTGNPLMEICSDVDPQDVVLILHLPANVTFLSETDGSGVYDQAANTVTWNLGTLDHLVHCFRTLIGVTIEVDQAVTDGTMLTASASISTSTPGDDPADNTASVDFQGGMLPLEVEFEGTSVSCQAGDVSDYSSDGQGLACLDSDLGGWPMGSSSRASVYVYSSGLTSPPRSLGELGPGTLNWIIAPQVAFTGGARGGVGFDPNGGALVGLSNGAGLDITQDLVVHNPNPYDIALRVFYASYGHTSCSNNNAGHPGNSFVEDSIPSTDCGYVDDLPSFSILYMDCDGVKNNCQRVIETEEGTTQEEIFSVIARVPASGSRNIDSIFQGGASADTNVLSPTVIHVGAASFNGLGQYGIALAGTSLNANFIKLRITAASPVDLLLTDPDGKRAGRGTDEEPPDLGNGIEILFSKAILNEIPGAFYSGPEAEPEVITIGLPRTGDYQLDVAGTGDGPFTLTFETLNADGQVISQQTVTGVATNGSLFTQEFTLTDNGLIRTSPRVYLPIVIH